MTLRTEQTDEYGFIVVSEEQRYERKKYLIRMRYLKGGATVGQYNQCKDLCKYLPEKKKMPNSLQMPQGMYWCKECQRLMKSFRCRCCGNLGRAKARHRNRDNEKRIDN
jgi:hypothetical protein